MWLFPKRLLRNIRLNPHSSTVPRWSSKHAVPRLLPVPKPTLIQPHSTARNTSLDSQPYEIPPSRLESKSHPLGWQAIQSRVERYFSENWCFTSGKEREGFIALGLSRAFSQFFPLTLNNRVEVTCKMHYLALLIDDQLEKMSSLEMLSYRNRVLNIAQGLTAPDRSTCLEWMLSDTIKLMREIDEPLANDLVHGFCALLRAQTAKERQSIINLGPYLEFRELDVGRTFYTALIRFGARLHLTPTQLQKTANLESCAFRYMGVLNDIYSWDREWRVYQATPTHGAHPFSAIYIFAQETGLPYAACKRLMYSYCRELEVVFQQTRDEIRGEDNDTPEPELEEYMKGLEYLMRGIELWSQWTPRYRSTKS